MLMATWSLLDVHVATISSSLLCFLLSLFFLLVFLLYAGPSRIGQFTLQQNF